MRDKLTKKRIKVDYESMIIFLHLDSEFVRYIFNKNSSISSRRSALAFLRSKKVDIEAVYFDMKEKGFSIDQDNSDFWCPLNSIGETNEGLSDKEVLYAEIDNTPDFFRGYWLWLC